MCCVKNKTQYNSSTGLEGGGGRGEGGGKEQASHSVTTNSILESISKYEMHVHIKIGDEENAKKHPTGIPNSEKGPQSKKLT